MTDYGITSTGFVPKTVDTITTEIVAELKVSISPTIDTSPKNPLGQIVGIFAAREARLWELASDLHDSRDPEKASGPLLDGVSAITGSFRQSPTYSTVLVTLAATQAASAAAGKFVIQAPGATTTWSNVSAFTFASAGSQSISFRANLPGAYTAGANSLTQVNTPVLGVSYTSNTAATPGTDRELDPAFRIRRAAELVKGGSSNDDAIAAALTNAETGVPNVTYAVVYSNRTSTTDANGTPPNAYQVVFWDGLTAFADPNAIAQKIWDEGPAGVQFYGTSSGTAYDANGKPQTVYFTRVSPVAVYVSATTTKNSALFPSDGLSQLNAAIVARANALLGVGVSVVDKAMLAACFSVAGVLDVPTFNIGTAPSPLTSTNITITPFQIAYVASTNVSVT